MDASLRENARKRGHQQNQSIAPGNHFEYALALITG
jgi:hypothetical protein